MSSDGKHAKKNGRGSATSGTRVLCPGRYLIHYGQLAALAEGENSPLLKTDIIGVDKQDDRAAARLFSSATIQYIVVALPDELGLTIYLYILGDLIDAQQNRVITHCERVKMLWWGRFFLEGWRQYVLRHPYYSVQTHFITRELYDILSVFINAMLLLILTHRDFFPNVPLFHWLNSTEANEHLFGCARKIQKDFTFVDWILMAQKVAVLMGGELATNLQAAQAKAAVGCHGYHHSWSDAHGIDIQNLSSFPSNIEFEDMIKVAHTEATALLHILGVETSGVPVVDEEGFADALAMLSSDPKPAFQGEQACESKAEVLAKLLQTDRDQFTAGQFNLDSDEKLTNLGIHATVAAVHDQLELERVLESEGIEELSTTPYRKHIEHVLNIVTREIEDRTRVAVAEGRGDCAGGDSRDTPPLSGTPSTAAMTTTTTNTIGNPARDESASAKRAETYTETMARLRTPLSYGTARMFNFETVIQERQRHETREAKSAVTYRFNNAVATGALASLKTSGWQDTHALLETEESEKLKAALVSQMTHALSATVLSDGKSDGKADASGVERKVRWRGGGEKGKGGEADGGTGAPEVAPKNPVAPKDDSVRRRVYTASGLEGSLPFLFASGGVSHFHPLQIGSWVVALSLIYLKGGGQRASHNQSASCTDINKLSRLVILKYIPIGDSCWMSPLTASATDNPTPSCPSFLYLCQPDLVTSLESFCPAPRAIESEQPLQPGLQMLTINTSLLEYYRQLEGHGSNVLRTVEALWKETRKRTKWGEPDGLNADEEIELDEGDKRARAEP